MGWVGGLYCRGEDVNAMEVQRVCGSGLACASENGDGRLGEWRVTFHTCGPVRRLLGVRKVCPSYGVA